MELYYKYQMEYREAFDDQTPNIYLIVDKYKVVKKTPKGVWIEPLGEMWTIRFGGKHFVLNNARKKFAYPTIEEAREGFMAKKRRQIRILAYQLAGAKQALMLAEGEKNDADKSKNGPKDSRGYFPPEHRP